MAIEYKGYAGAINNTQPSQHLTDAKYIQGTYYAVNSMEELNALPKKTGDTAATDGIIINGCLAYNTANSKFYQYNGTSWDEKQFGGNVTVSSSGVTDGTNTYDASNKVTANSDITSATKCKITYDKKGLVTAGADLTVSDIPNLTASKITDLHPVATNGSYNDLKEKPTIPTVSSSGVSDGTTTYNASDKLPLSAGSSAALTGDLYFGSSSGPHISYNSTDNSIEFKF